MPRFKVYRVKRYVAFVDAETADDAVDMALDVSGREWKLSDDRTENVADIAELVPLRSSVLS